MKMRLFASPGRVKMEIEVNGELVRVFSGARVKHAIRKYSAEDYEKIREGKKLIRDEYGNEVMLGGELTGGEELFIVDSNDSQSNP